MAKLCECGCGVEFSPIRSDGRYASTTCRSRAFRRAKANAADAQLVADATVVSIAGRRVKASTPTAPTTPGAGGMGGVEAAITRELGDALLTSLGQQAIVLARRLDEHTDTGSALASVSKQLVVLTAAALREKAPDAENDLVGTVQADVIAIRQQYANAGT